MLKKNNNDDTKDTLEVNKTYFIVGLGNPGRKYKNSRHNVGFMVIDEVAKKLNFKFTRMQSKSMISKGLYLEKKIILGKPRTFMNLSGQSVASLFRFYKIPFENLLIIFDDADLELDRIRLLPEGGSSGHKGMKSIIRDLGGQNFPRLRIGISRPTGKMSTPSYVLQDFSKEEVETLEFVLDHASDAVLKFISEGIDTAMNIYNQKT
jgi:PTH1 family peptidyl-tRNA hydrolase